ncbi:2'-5' RNA ligase family protein [Phycicoccus sp. DTK01]|uniref:2'-5' RNA ligase family protein n=1 Tax=Phycicoccus sp. DTK01 TaxID=2785745 RepID=UPI001A8C9396|nr:2'-5' RNA ligase family protein [Phycicoccus sp. DTK01]GIL36820.1 phosphoesterase [Phycicoccus sp. DTK01]
MPVHGVAVTIPEPWGEQLQSARAGFGDPMADAIPPHVTLLPPTVVPTEHHAEFTDHLDDVCRAVRPFEMVLSGTGTFRPVSPVVFVQVSKGIGECERLESAVRGGPVERTLDFPYHPHVTIAHHLDDDALDRAFEGLAGFRCAFTVASIELYHHDPDGVWRVIRSLPLGG